MCRAQEIEKQGEVSSAGRVICLDQGWRVLQDVYDEWEKSGLYRNGRELFGWERIDRLTHLQLLFASQPYFGRELRYFNQAPWWYRLKFETPPQAKKATLRFEGVDYYAKVWLNGRLLGEHEGYYEPFEFEVGPLLSRQQPNTLIVKVSSPWDTQVAPGGGADWQWQRILGTVRTMLKGSYAHADTFVQRDVNPVGIWQPVKLILHDGLRALEDPAVVTTVSRDANRADVSISWPVALDEGARDIEFGVRIYSEPEGREVGRTSKGIRVQAGTTVLHSNVPVDSPRLWNTWDHGGPALYRAELEAHQAGRTILASRTTFGIRTIELRRSATETTFLLNGKPLYLRGATYWSDLYVSAANRARYERDVAAAVRVGINAFRLHVHVEKPEFYEICDRMGVVLVQDFDLNWVFPTDEAFTRRAVAVFGGMIKKLRNHPSIIGWICMNEAGHGDQDFRTKVRPGPQLVAEARRLDPGRPTIKSSWDQDDVESGDSHDYRGSLSGGKFTDIFGTTAKLNTEFGVDAPPGVESARSVPRMAERLKDVLPHVAELHDYQYRLIKYYIEHFRMQKYAPNSGYFQFMWIDFSPQSFYGVYDYWGHPKTEGIGGGLRAMEESNGPLGIFMEYKDSPVALHAVNDSLADLGDCVAEWTVTSEAGHQVTQGKSSSHLGPDSHVRIGDLAFPVTKGAVYQIKLVLRGPDGRELARNVYRDPFNHPAHPRGHPERIDHELGMRLWWAGEDE
jgi:beta-mannosidase